jgi:hypothetical protein
MFKMPASRNPWGGREDASYDPVGPKSRSFAGFSPWAATTSSRKCAIPQYLDRTRLCCLKIRVPCSRDVAIESRARYLCERVRFRHPYRLVTQDVQPTAVS